MKSNNQFSLSDLVKKINLYLDGDLTSTEERTLMKEIKANPQYTRILNQEKKFKEFLKARLQRKEPSAALIQSIKDSIHARIKH